MVDDKVNMSLDEIITQSRNSRTRGRGRGSAPIKGNRGRGGGRGRGRGRGGDGAPRGRSRSRVRSNSGNRSLSRTRSASRGRRGRQMTRSASINRINNNNRSRSRLRGRSASRGRSTSRGRGGLQSNQSALNRLGEGGLRRNSVNARNISTRLQQRLGVDNRNKLKRGLGRRIGTVTNNPYSSVGLRSDQIIKAQKQQYVQKIVNRIRRNSTGGVIRSQTFTRSPGVKSTELMVSVKNDLAQNRYRRRNSVGSGSIAYLNKQLLEQLNAQLGGVHIRRGPGSVQSQGSNRSRQSNRSNNSIRGRGRGRGRNRVGGKFINKQVLNPKLQKEIAAIQGKLYNPTLASEETPVGINCSLSPATTSLTFNQRFANM